MFALGVLDLSRVDAARAADGQDSNGGAITLAGVCFAACAAATLYGIYLVVPRFH